MQGRGTKGNLAWYFNSFLQVFERGFLQEISYFNGKEWPIKAGWISEPYLIYQGWDKTVFVRYDCFDIQGAGFFQTPGIFIDSPGMITGAPENYAFFTRHNMSQTRPILTICDWMFSENLELDTWIFKTNMQLALLNKCSSLACPCDYILPFFKSDFCLSLFQPRPFPSQRINLQLLILQ